MKGLSGQDDTPEESPVSPFLVNFKSHSAPLLLEGSPNSAL